MKKLLIARFENSRSVKCSKLDSLHKSAIFLKMCKLADKKREKISENTKHLKRCAFLMFGAKLYFSSFSANNQQSNKIYTVLLPFKPHHKICIIFACQFCFSFFFVHFLCALTMEDIRGVA
jgi:hypothetical protein